LTASQRTVLALSLEEEFSMVAKERMRAGGWRASRVRKKFLTLKTKKARRATRLRRW
jgi:hypothetical protein